jgi:hypothetical protein
MRAAVEERRRPAGTVAEEDQGHVLDGARAGRRRELCRSAGNEPLIREMAGVHDGDATPGRPTGATPAARVFSRAASVVRSRPVANAERTTGAPDTAIASWNAELAFRAVVEATADKAGLEFMRHLVKNLAESLGVAYAFVAEFAGAADRVRTIAFWDHTDWRPNIEYGLPGTPCERVAAGALCLYRDDVQHLFPADSDLVSLGARSYLGVPLRGAQGQPLGHLAALDTRPMPDDPRGLTIFEVFANRARVEMERIQAGAIMGRRW